MVVAVKFVYSHTKLKGQLLKAKYILRAFWFINTEIGILYLHQESLAQNFLINLAFDKLLKEAPTR